MMLLGISFTWSKSAPSFSMQYRSIASSTGLSHVEYTLPARPAAEVMPSPARDRMPEVLCCRIAATAVMPSGSSRSRLAAMVSCASMANCACPAAHIRVAPFSGGCTIVTSSPASS